jgi:hypothetical protein
MKLAHKLHAALMLSAVGLMLPGIATALDYRYVDGGIVDRDASTRLGVRLAGSAALTPPLAVFGEVVDDDEYTQATAGLMFRAPIGTNLDFNAGGSVEMVDNGAADDTGLGARMGLRWLVPQSRGLELSPEVRHVMVFDQSITSLRANALFPVGRNLLMQGALQGGDDDRVELGLRYSFGPARAAPPRRVASSEEPAAE